ncbi:glycine cleavage system protein T [Vreelandella azerica]|uniref:glycine cleavage system protein T n=1 Tax=Vreelandella azerica TaxID=2732867 RepID=UPI001F384D54|nr:glycine cleavage system protein T [Halomonas azerica]
MSAVNTGFGTQIRKSPYFAATQRWGAQGYSVYNHMYIPRDFGSPEQNFWNLVNTAILCDVGVERQVEITGPDAAEFTQLLTPRNLSNMAVGQCKYVLITNASGGILNDPILLRLAENHFWLSLADSDILLWAQGVAINSGLDVTISEPDVSPLQLQGPVSGEIMKALFGDSIMDLRYYWLREVELDGIPMIVSRTGWSSELGYELYLRDGSRGDELWEKSWPLASLLVFSLAIPRLFAELKAACCPIMPMPIFTPTPLSWVWIAWWISTWKQTLLARRRSSASSRKAFAASRLACASMVPTP